MRDYKPHASSLGDGAANVIAVICYIALLLLWTAGAVVIAAIYLLERKSGFVRFHAMQAGLLWLIRLFSGGGITFESMAAIATGDMSYLHNTFGWEADIGVLLFRIGMGALVGVFAVLAAVKAFRWEYWRIPVVGWLAQLFCRIGREPMYNGGEEVPPKCMPDWNKKLQEVALAAQEEERRQQEKPEVVVVQLVTEGGGPVVDEGHRLYMTADELEHMTGSSGRVIYMDDDGVVEQVTEPVLDDGVLDGMDLVNTIELPDQLLPLEAEDGLLDRARFDFEAPGGASVDLGLDSHDLEDRAEDTGRMAQLIYQNAMKQDFGDSWQTEAGEDEQAQEPAQLTGAGRGVATRDGRAGAAKPGAGRRGSRAHAQAGRAKAVMPTLPAVVTGMNRQLPAGMRDNLAAAEMAETMAGLGIEVPGANLVREDKFDLYARVYQPRVEPKADKRPVDHQTEFESIMYSHERAPSFQRLVNRVASPKKSKQRDITGGGKYGAYTQLSPEMMDPPPPEM